METIREIYRYHSYRIIHNDVLVLILTAEDLAKFTDKKSYLEWVVAWKDFYKNLAARQRQLRIELSKPHSIYTYNDLASKMSERHNNRLILAILLEARKVGKKLSWQQKKQLQVQ